MQWILRKQLFKQRELPVQSPEWKHAPEYRRRPQGYQGPSWNRAVHREKEEVSCRQSLSYALVQNLVGEEVGREGGRGEGQKKSRCWRAAFLREAL